MPVITSFIKKEPDWKFSCESAQQYRKIQDDLPGSLPNSTPNYLFDVQLIQKMHKTNFLHSSKALLGCPFLALKLRASRFGIRYSFKSTGALRYKHFVKGYIKINSLHSYDHQGHICKLLNKQCFPSVIKHGH